MSINSEKANNNILINDALSDIGVYISDYSNGNTIISRPWKELQGQFKISDNQDDLLDNVHPDDKERVSAALYDVYSGASLYFKETFRIKRADNSYRWIKSDGRTVKQNEEGKPVIVVGSDTDVSELKETEERLLISIEKERKNLRELETIRQIVAIISTSLDRDETVQTILAEMKRIIPYDAGSVQLLKGNELRVIGLDGFKEELKVTDISKLRFKYPLEGSLSTAAIQDRKPILTNNVARDFPTFTQPMKTKTIKSWIGIPLIIRGNALGLLALDSLGDKTFTEHHLKLAAIIGDHITIALENSLLHEKAYKMAMEDALTGIGSRHRFQIEGRLMFESAIRSESPITLVLFDIDHFKKVNDKFGHDVGDIILKRISRIMKEEIRATDLLARYGGEEFVLMFSGTEESDALTAIDRIRKLIESRFHDEIDNNVTVSAGLFTKVPQKKDRLEQFVKHADCAMYKSKHSGRNRVSVLLQETGTLS